MKSDMDFDFSKDSQWLGIRPFQEVELLQNKWLEELQRETLNRLRPGALIGCEHEALITCGISASDQDVKNGMGSEAGLSSEMIPVLRVARGGRATIHSPGQLVIYPLWRISGRRVSQHIYELLAVTKVTLEAFDIQAEVGVGSRNIGLFVKDQKIAFVGIKVKRGWAYHGLAVNVSNDLNLFKHIVPCGSQDVKLTSLQALGRSCSPEDVFKVWQSLWWSRHSSN